MVGCTLTSPAHRLREILQLVAAITLSVLVVNLGYQFEGSCRRVGQFQFQSELFADGSTSSDVDTPTGNRLANVGLGWLPLPWPANYVQGIDTQRADFERGLRSYLRGRSRSGGWWYFYVYALAVKMPLGTWALLAIALLALLRSRNCRSSAADELPLTHCRHRDLPASQLTERTEHPSPLHAARVAVSADLDQSGSQQRSSDATV